MPLALWPERWKFCRAPSMSTLTRPKSCRPRMLMAVPGSSGRSCTHTPGMPKRTSETRLGISCCNKPGPTSADGRSDVGGKGSDGWACNGLTGPDRTGARRAGAARTGVGASATGAERTVLTGARVLLRRSRVLVPTTVTGSSVTDVLCAVVVGAVVLDGVALCEGALGASAVCAKAATDAALIKAIVDTPTSSARAPRPQESMTQEP